MRATVPRPRVGDAPRTAASGAATGAQAVSCASRRRPETRPAQGTVQDLERSVASAARCKPSLTPALLTARGPVPRERATVAAAPSAGGGGEDALRRGGPAVLRVGKAHRREPAVGRAVADGLRRTRIAAGTLAPLNRAGPLRLEGLRPGAASRNCPQWLKAPDGAGPGAPAAGRPEPEGGVQRATARTRGRRSSRPPVSSRQAPTQGRAPAPVLGRVAAGAAAAALVP